MTNKWDIDEIAKKVFGMRQGKLSFKERLKNQKKVFEIKLNNKHDYLVVKPACTGWIIFTVNNNAEEVYDEHIAPKDLYGRRIENWGPSVEIYDRNYDRYQVEVSYTFKKL